MQRGEIRQKVNVDNSPSGNILHVRKTGQREPFSSIKDSSRDSLSESNVTKCRLRVRRKTFATVLLVCAVCNLIKDFEKKITQGSSF